MLSARHNIWFLLAVALLTALSIFGLSRREIQKGLDVVGGVRLTYQMVLDEDQEESRAELQRRMVSVLLDRASAALGVVEGSVVARGEDQLIVELPGYTEVAEAQEVMSSTARIMLYHATNVSTEMQNRRYDKLREVSDDTGFYVVFARRGSDQEILPGTPEYEEMMDSWRLILDGESVRRAGVQVDGNTRRPTFDFMGEGANTLQSWSRANNQRGEMLAFVLDGRVLSINPIARGAVLRDSAFIDGSFEASYVQRLVNLINAGALPVDLEQLSAEAVSPTIGEQAFDQMLLAGLISLGLICVFLIIYYAFPGLIAAFAMLLYVLFTLTVLTYINATLSLAALAGFVLSVGMAVDSNILVFERVKEEIKSGKGLLTSIELGFKRAMTAIIDSNACTVITSMVLFQFGTGPVRGFATTLIVGVAVSFLTAVAVTRTLLIASVKINLCADPKFYAIKRNWFGESLGDKDHKPWSVIQGYRKYFIGSAIAVVLGFIFVGLGGLKFNVEFQGGFEGVYELPQGTSASSPEIRAQLDEAGISGANIKIASTETGTLVYVTVADEALGDLSGIQAREAIAQAANLPLSGGGFSEIGPVVQREMVQNTIYGIVLSIVLVTIFLGIRFGIALGGFKNGVKLGFAAMAALFHDVLFVIATAGLVGYLLGWEISALFITAMLSVLGFSVHDTVIVFDRMRENLRRAVKTDNFADIANRSIMQSVARSVNTSVTAVMPLILLIAIGTPTPELKFFCLAMLVGIAVGTYSSIFIASPILYLIDKRIEQKKGKQFTLLEEALRDRKIRLAAMQAAATGGGAADPDLAAQYGTIKRKESVEKKATRALDDDED